jgi:(E)-4-hydroxy-3-methylbut-2-enyl-diphosphate synthase
VVRIGNISLGGDEPIRIQSMTTTDTLDTKATVEQSIRIIEAGGELVRITAPSLKEAENLANIKKELRAAGFETPIVADIHFTPNAAEIAARIVEKVRVNPGNYADKKKFAIREYTDSEYQATLERLESRFLPLVHICKEHGTAMRIGTNHGSLSDRILNRYGDTPQGMVESALEFVRVCERESYHEIVLSMKASNTIVMVQAYRLLMARMKDEGMNYPVHLGVTEAGEAEDGRIKSAVGIGALLEDGIGDTVRVSLTEEPEYEIPVARELVARYENRAGHAPIEDIATYPVNPYEHHKRTTRQVLNIGGGNVPRVFADYASAALAAEDLKSVGYEYSKELDKWNMSDLACDFLYLGMKELDFEIPGTLGLVNDYRHWKTTQRKGSYPLFCADEYLGAEQKSIVLNFIVVNSDNLSNELIEGVLDDTTVVFVLFSENDHAMADQRRMIIKLMNSGSAAPVILKRNYKDVSEANLLIYPSTDMGGLLIDGLGDGVWLNATTGQEELSNAVQFGMLQATRTRISKAEYISCPSCGRTLFDLQETTAKIRARTDHLKGVKIGIMGCIVNGPGEMADADYGYVGTGVGKITLYKGQEVVERNIPAESAVDSLIGLIKEHGDWVDKPNT